MHHLARCAAPALAAAIFLTAGCDTMTVRTDYDPGADFSGLKAYAWLPEPGTPSGDPRLDNPLLNTRIHKAVETQLAAKGFEKRPAGEADMLVGYHTTLDRKVDVNVVDSHYGYGPGWRSYGYGGGRAGVYVDRYEEGTLILDLVDVRSKKLVWRGSATDRVDFSSTPEQSQENLNEAVRKMLEDFPPPKPQE